VNQEGALKIGDLGISKSAKVINAKSSSNKSTGRFGAAANYMSPEIVEEKKDYTNKIDIWALGCVIYECATFEKLFDDADSNDFEIKIKILTAQIVYPNDFHPKLTNVLNG
jgi:serine/threonine protein kinase